ncbi:hypothetical protein [Halapricum desulfuricans]|uniref:hypothetical protein n=1 Tax=Halapricum desulfuricans TaxID=2841257 RepID=UPI001E5E68B7|nr:hypothetical protein [Halapricum desulfuricans]
MNRPGLEWFENRWFSSSPHGASVVRRTLGPNAWAVQAAFLTVGVFGGSLYRHASARRGAWAEDGHGRQYEVPDSPGSTY